MYVMMQFDVPVHCRHKVPFFYLSHVLVPVHKSEKTVQYIELHNDYQYVS